jgi:hypothetical protein
MKRKHAEDAQKEEREMRVEGILGSEVGIEEFRKNWIRIWRGFHRNPP